MSNSNIQQQVLALVFALTLLLGFGLIAVTAEYYEYSNTKELLFISDSNTEFITASVSDNYVYSDESAIDTHARNLKGTTVTFISLDPIYLGNNTWAISVPTFDNPPYVFCDAYYQMNLPNMERWMLTDVFLNWTVGTQVYTGGATILHFNEPFPLTDGGSASDKTAETPLFVNYGLTNPIGLHHEVPLPKALKINQDSQNKQYTSLECAVFIPSLAVTWEGFAWTFTVEIYGYKQTATSLTGLLILGLSIGTISNFSVMIFMTDRVDLFGYKQDIPRKRR